MLSQGGSRVESLTESATLVGRSGVVKDIVRCLRDGGTSGALIVGNPGTGKTAVSRAVIRELRPHTAVIRLAATPALSAVPFGALAPYLGELPARAGSSTTPDPRAPPAPDVWTSGARFGRSHPSASRAALASRPGERPGDCAQGGMAVSA